jgi:thioester reductase-like protein
VLARTREELIEKLTAFLAGKENEDVMRGHVWNAAAVTNVLTGREKQEFIDLLVRSGDPRRLARLWSDGVIPDWRGLRATEAGRKISLPTYPFTRDRHWIANRKPVQLVTSAGHAETSKVVVPIKPEASARTKEEAAPLKSVWEYRFSRAGAHGATADKPLTLSVAETATLFVRQLFANHLPIAPDEVDEDWQLMDTGITSLDMANMTQSLKEHLDPDFSPIAFFECTTVRSLCNLLAQKYPAVFEGMSVTKQTPEQHTTPARLGRKIAPAQPAPAQLASGIPAKPLHVQDAESALPLPDLTGVPEAYRGGMRCVLLTGVTGFLGIHVLAELLSSDPEAKAYCLVRASSRDHGLQRILEQAEAFELQIDPARVTVMCGDINDPSLGLTDEDWQACCRDVQQIIHASAHVNHIEGYATFRDSTRGMKEIIRLACTHSVKLIQFISSIAGCALKIGEEFSIFDREDFLAQGEAVHGGYGQSKWVQEKFLQRAHASGVPFVIYRFGELSGSSRTGRGQTDDMVHRLLQMRLAVECRQKISNDVLDMLPVDFVAQLIVGTGKTPQLWNTVVHATHLKPYSLANLYRKAGGNGLRFEPVTRARFVSKCYDFVRFIYSIDPVNGFVLECVLRDAEGSIRHRKMMDGYFSVIFPFEQGNFKHALQRLGLALPDWNALLDRYFEHWNQEDCGFMARIREYQQWSRRKPGGRLADKDNEKVMVLENVGAG